MADQRELSIVVKAYDEASKVLKSLGDTAEKTGSSIKDTLEKNVAGLGAAFGIASAAIITSIGAYEESESNAAQLNAVLQSTKGIAGITAHEVLNLSAALQQQSKFSDEAVTDAQSLLLTFTNIGKNIFPQATQTVLDMSQALGQDLKSSSIQLGKALQDPILGVTALRRVGVNFNEQQQEMIKKMVESGHLLDAQKTILKELATEFGGSALASSKTFAGQMTILKNNVNDLQETIGKGLVEALTHMGGGFDKVNESIINLNGFLSTHHDILMGIVVALVVVAATFGVLFVAALIAVAGTAGVVIALIGAVAAVIGFLATMIIFHWSQIQTFFTNLITQFMSWFTSIETTIANTLTVISSAITNFINGIGPAFLNFFTFDIPYAVGFAIGWLEVNIPRIVANIVAWFSELPGKALAIFNSVKTNIITTVTDAITWLTVQLSALPGKIQGWIAAVPGIVGKVFNDAKQAVLGKMEEMWNGVMGWWDKIKGILDSIYHAAEKALNTVKGAFGAGKSAGMSFAEGGWVPRTGMALVHAGEYVLSRDMLAGQQSIGAPITTNNSSLNVGPVYVSGIDDIDTLSHRLAFMLATNGAL